MHRRSGGCRRGEARCGLVAIDPRTRIDPQNVAVSGVRLPRIPHGLGTTPKEMGLGPAGNGPNATPYRPDDQGGCAIAQPPFSAFLRCRGPSPLPPQQQLNSRRRRVLDRNARRQVSPLQFSPRA